MTDAAPTLPIGTELRITSPKGGHYFAVGTTVRITRNTDPGCPLAVGEYMATTRDPFADNDWEEGVTAFVETAGDEPNAEVVTFAPHEPTADDWRDAANAIEQENAELRDRLEALTQELATVRATLAVRSEAVNRTGESNDRLRAKVAAVHAALHMGGQTDTIRVRAAMRALADQETQ